MDGNPVGGLPWDSYGFSLLHRDYLLCMGSDAFGCQSRCPEPVAANRREPGTEGWLLYARETSEQIAYVQTAMSERNHANLSTAGPHRKMEA
jgi:hypothetical protein